MTILDGGVGPVPNAMTLRYGVSNFTAAISPTLTKVTITVCELFALYNYLSVVTFCSIHMPYHALDFLCFIKCLIQLLINTQFYCDSREGCVNVHFYAIV